MMDWTISEGETYEKALSSLLKTLGADKSEIELEELGEHKKMFGFGKTVVKLRGKLKRESFEDLTSAMNNIDIKPVKKKEKERKRESFQNKIREQEPEETKELSEIAKKAADLLQFILDKIQIKDAKIITTESKNRILLNVESNTGGLVIGHKGETLEAMQTIIDILVNRQSKERVKVIVDTENYRNRREDMLISMAKKSAKDALRTGKEVYLGPMRAADRKLIHCCLQKNPKVTTKSEGDGGGRQVVVCPT